jgi:hypothetical protein
MHSRVYDFLENNASFYKLQFGFRQKHSTNHSLLSIIENIRDSLDNKTFSCGVFIDLEKAFDTVNHSILLKKLEHYGIRGIANSWFKSYLLGRQQKVCLNGTSSPNAYVTCGVPQGSILGPLLFILYINDMHNAVKNSTVYHFADDTNLLCSHKNPKTLRKLVNDDLRVLFTWLCSNRLSLNVAKTEFVIFKPPRCPLSERITLKLNGKTLYESKKIKYLGLILDDKLTWSAHVHELSKKINRSLGILYKLRQFCPKSVLRSLYFSLIHSNIGYGLLAWGTATDKIKYQIIKLQKRAIRIVTNSKYRESTRPLFKKTGILTVLDMFDHQMACMMYEFDKNVLPDSLSELFTRVSNIHNYDTRMSSKNKLVETHLVHTKTHGDNLLKCSGPKVLNKLKDLDIYYTIHSKKSFAAKYKNILLSVY